MGQTLKGSLQKNAQIAAKRKTIKTNGEDSEYKSRFCVKILSITAYPIITQIESSKGASINMAEKNTISGKDFVFQIDGNEKIKKKQLEAESRKELSHYTTFDTLKKIFKNKRFRFKRIDLVNDIKEKALFENYDIAKLVYIMCFTHRKSECVPMWCLYGKENDGVRIDFTFKQSPIYNQLFDFERPTINSTDNEIEEYNSSKKSSDWYYKLNLIDVLYDIEQINVNPIEIMVDGKEKYNPASMGVIKRCEWDYEEETRFVLHLATLRESVKFFPDTEFFDVPITFDNMENITITFNPWMSDEKKAEIKSYFLDSLTPIKPTVDFKNSVLTNEIDLKWSFGSKKN